MTSTHRGHESPSDRSDEYRDLTNTKRRPTGPTLVQTGNMVVLLAIVLSVAPGIDLAGAAVLALALTGIVFYAVEALGAVYDIAAGIAREVRA